MVAGIFDNLADVVDAGVRGRIHLDDIDMARFHDGLAVHADLRHDHGGFLNLSRQQIVESAGQNARRRGLADAARAGQHIGLVHAPEVKGVGQRAHQHVLADQVIKIAGPVFARQHAVGGGPASRNRRRRA